MALRHIPRRRAPLDGTWFRTEARLSGIVYDAARHEDERGCSEAIRNSWVPVWVSMRPHQGQATRETPDGIYYHPVVKVGNRELSPEIEVESCYRVHLERDSDLDGWFSPNQWIYRPYENDQDAPGEDVSVWACDKCGDHLYRDDEGRRSHKSACLVNGVRVCRNCDVTGLVYAAEVGDRLERCRKLADFVGAECRADFESRIEFLSRGRSFGQPCQTRLFLDGRWSFFWRDFVFTPEGKRDGMVGGLIQHGPLPRLQADGSFTFTTWDYAQNCEREATEAEIRGLHWGIHT